MLGNYLVTGIAGFIGSAIAKNLLVKGHHIVGIDNLSTGYLENIPEDALFFEGDCQDISIYSKIPDYKYNAIIHIAGQSSGEVSFDDPIYDLRTNTESTLCLLRYALEVGCNRLLYASSMSVYGDHPDEPISEIAMTKPLSFYGIGKLASENYLRIYEQYGIRSTSLRLFNVYGPGQNLINMRQGMVSIFMSQMLNNSFIHIKGSHERYRDFIYIDDAVDSFTLCLKHNESADKVINIGTGKRTTVRELLDKMIGLYGQDVECKFEGNTPGDQMGIYADINNAQEIIHYKPKVGLDEGLSKMIIWAKGKQDVSE